MAEVSYYFNAYSYSEWADPDNFDDGSIETFAYVIPSGLIHTFDSNTCPGTDLGTITKVEVRIHGYGDGADRIDLIVTYTAGDGDKYETTPGSSPAWGSYVDITTDTNAPSPWTWADVQGLDCTVGKVTVGKGNTMYGSKMEIRVTYTPVVPPLGLENKSANMGSKMVAAGLI